MSVNRKALIELLELAHGYAIAGHIMPFRLAVLEAKANNEVRDLAKSAIDAQLTHLPQGTKPDAKTYADAIGAAINQVESQPESSP